eukprot:3579787-Pyramimonas_sp.AAC.1
MHRLGAFADDVGVASGDLLWKLWWAAWVSRRSLGLGWASTSIAARHGWYFLGRPRFCASRTSCGGVGLTPPNSCLRTVAPCRKYLGRVGLVQSLCLGLAKSVAQCNLLAASVLSYVAQFMPPVREVLRLERGGVQRLACAPNNSMPSQLLQELRDVGLPVECTCLERLSKAS